MAALLQLVCGLITMVVVFGVGPEPATAQEYFDLLQNNRLAGLIRMDFASVLTMGLYPLTLFGLYAALKRDQRPPPWPWPSPLGSPVPSCGWADIPLSP